jgi:hypothetical protein
MKEYRYRPERGDSIAELEARVAKAESSMASDKFHIEHLQAELADYRKQALDDARCNKALYDAMTRTLLDARVEIAELVAMLRMAEWHNMNDNTYCPCCYGHESSGHAPSCALAAILAKYKDVK